MGLFFLDEWPGYEARANLSMGASTGVPAYSSTHVLMPWGIYSSNKWALTGVHKCSNGSTTSM